MLPDRAPQPSDEPARDDRAGVYLAVQPDFCPAELCPVRLGQAHAGPLRLRFRCYGKKTLIGLDNPALLIQHRYGYGMKPIAQDGISIFPASDKRCSLSI